MYNIRDPWWIGWQKGFVASFDRKKREENVGSTHPESGGQAELTEKHIVQSRWDEAQSRDYQKL